MCIIYTVYGEQHHQLAQTSANSHTSQTRESMCKRIYSRQFTQLLYFKLSRSSKFELDNRMLGIQSLLNKLLLLLNSERSVHTDLYSLSRSPHRVWILCVCLYVWTCSKGCWNSELFLNVHLFLVVEIVGNKRFTCI